MQFTTPVPIQPLPKPIGLNDSLVLLGSCFSEHIGDLLNQYKFQALANPFGTIFNPESLAVLIEWVFGTGEMPESLIVLQDGVYKHLLLHSAIYATNKQAFQSRLLDLKTQVAEKLQSSQYLLLTLGTAWVYEHIETERVVANCHKLPSKYFNKRLLSVSNIQNALERISQLLPQTQLILTISPVRHLKDTLPLNHVSKATLRLGIHQFIEKKPTAYYFPSYEIMIDELRDYRFYEIDLIHPNKIGIQYIWEKFLLHCLKEEARGFISRWSKLRQSLAHRPLVPYTPAHKRFLEKLHQQLQVIEEVSVEEEKASVEAQIGKC